MHHTENPMPDINDLESRIQYLEQQTGLQPGSCSWANSLIGPLWILVTVAAITWGRHFSDDGVAWLVCVAIGLMLTTALRTWSRTNTSNRRAQ